VVATGDDGLQRKVVVLLEDGEVRAARRGAGPIIDIDDRVGGDVLRARVPSANLRVDRSKIASTSSVPRTSMPLPTLVTVAVANNVAMPAKSPTSRRAAYVASSEWTVSASPVIGAACHMVEPSSALSLRCDRCGS